MSGLIACRGIGFFNTLAMDRRLDLASPDAREIEFGIGGSKRASNVLFPSDSIVPLVRGG